MKNSFAALFAGAVALSMAHAQDEQTDAQPAATDYPAVADAIDQTMQAYHYDPAELAGAPYRQIVAQVAALADTVEADEAFVTGFAEIWKNGPFSHVQLSKAQQSADDLTEFLDTMRIGGGGAVLSWQGDVAVLTVNTMMGLDTIEEIDAAYAAIAEQGAEKLIIDLRENGGGAFAIRPLVNHLTDKAFIAGGFISQPWNASQTRAPKLKDMKKVAPWEGWSIRSFWKDAQENALTVVQFEPSAPIYDGPVYLLTSARTASAAELATDALKVSGRATIIGEKTAGEMLSQKIYDIPGGFHLSLPIADYYSAKHGRIEGAGVVPDIASPAANAMDVALGQ
jgi:C-terminal processing protease CtpA/Prc